MVLSASRSLSRVNGALPALAELTIPEMASHRLARPAPPRVPAIAARQPAPGDLCDVREQRRQRMGQNGSMSDEPLALISSDPNVMHGQVVVKGTRVPVSIILDCMAAGMSVEEILAEYPSLTLEGVRAAAAYGALLAREELVPLPGGA
jgi:uncharacterized protein (DUF433 family)